ncbi:hypothetical protein KDN34_15245 [Shewanella yunxiaonensis]|uniref:Uncharacterized protein n=1 Tax=Shewanella yunxiaonensis TaxID=2829809 RepID=A0ABX7YT22_9GAMM|nr:MULTISPECIES: hypothetical protein [Shewanella]MDF0534186.1 hypothetical protein [Shewanella sp. A32]QUN05525.1 hypothetical protein KDN34_15245 [Shewanella yunxiaonensis]
MQPFTSQDSLIKSTPATVQLGVAKADGRLVLEHQRLTFEPFNRQLGMGPYQIALSSIVSAKKCRGTAAGVFPISCDALELQLQDGSVYQFIVANPQEWIRELLH